MNHNLIKKIMKTFFKLKWIIPVILMIGCAGNDDNEIPAQNEPPGSFSLTTIADNAAEVDLLPSFSWTASIDPDGDQVKYNLYIDTNPNPITLVKENLNTTTVTLTSSLISQTNYYWKVVAKDGKGGETASTVFSFTTLVTANQAPGSFTLLTSEDEGTGVDLSPTFTWETAIDPDDDPVFYELYMDQNPDPTTLIEANLSTTSFRYSQRLPLLNTYYWKVIAKDSKGAQTESAVFSFTTRNLNLAVQATANANFTARNYHRSVVYDNAMWVIGGQDAIDFTADVYKSTDGISWDLMTSVAEFKSRKNHSVLSYNNKIWVIAGQETGLERDSWSSTDGTSWTPITLDGGYLGRASHTSVVFDNDMWVIGGNGYNDVWYSGNGEDWTEATPNAQFSGRIAHSSVVFDDKIWVIGGFDGANELNDVWYSEDGITWIQAIDHAAFPARQEHTTVVMDGKMWVIGGLDSATYFDDVWYSEDGINWALALASAGFSARRSHTSVVYDHKIWIIAGFDKNIELKNDVWYLE